jgi:penicillin amidase
LTRLARRSVAVAVALSAVALIASAALVLSTFPRRSGTVQVAGLRGRVTIATDAHGVPAIRAASIADAMFGIGWAHARDRLWQMEFERRVASGRIAEVLGERAVPTDSFLRTVGFRRAAEAAWRASPPEVRSLLEAYAAGVNAFVAGDRARPVELRLLRMRADLEPWTPVDSLAWGKMMAWDLSRNAEDEIRLARLVELLGPERANELLPVNLDEPTILTEAEWAPMSTSSPPTSHVSRLASHGPWKSLEHEFALLEPLGLGGGEGVGSNSWVAAGSRTASGFPLLANDPHLKLRMPPVWYLASLEAPGLSVAGATLPGIPFVLIGRNAKIAWGLTSLEPDVQDLFVEKTDAEHPGRYLHDREWKPFSSRVERIRVRGGAEVSITVRASVHGPIVGAVMAGALPVAPKGAHEDAPEVALRWTGLDPDDRTAEAFWALDRANGWDEFLAGVSLVHAAAQNFLYADRDGHIGYASSGAMPVRPRSDGRLPVPGTGEDDWRGYLPFDELPRVLDPPRGFLVAANNRVTPLEPYAFGRSWAPPYRAARIAELLSAKPVWTAEDFGRIQADDVSLLAREMSALLADTRPRDEASRQALDLLRGWNGEMAEGSPAAAVYAAWYAELASMPDDELDVPRGSERRGPQVPRGATRAKFLLDAIRAGSPWCDDVRTPVRETCADFQSKTLSRAAASLRARLGPDPSRWSWGALHRLRVAHDVFDAVPLLRHAFDLEAGRGGDGATVNVGGFAQDGTFRMVEGASFRQVVDLAPQGRSLYALPGGQSGNVLDPRYRDLFPLWQRGELFGMGEGTVEVLTLEPMAPRPGS